MKYLMNVAVLRGKVWKLQDQVANTKDWFNMTLWKSLFILLCTTFDSWSLISYVTCLESLLFSLILYGNILMLLKYLGQDKVLLR